MVDIGFTHVALMVSEIDRTIDFWHRYAGMDVIHRRPSDDGGEVVWMSDHTRPFVIVFIEGAVTHRLGPNGHLGVACETRARVDEMAALAEEEGRATLGPTDLGPPVGYFVFIEDPDGHILELSFGQEVRLAVEANGVGDGDPG